MNTASSKTMCLSALLLGAAGFGLRWSLYRVGFDEKGLLTAHHPLTLALILAGTAMVLLSLLLALRSEKKLCCCPTGGLAALGDICAALGLVYLLVTGPNLAVPVLVLGFVAVAALAAAGLSHLRGRQPFFLTYGMFCVFLGFYLVNRYQIWSQDPQLMDYLLALLAGVAMMLYAYQMTAGCLGQCGRRSWLVLGGLGAFAGLAGAAGGEMRSLCLGGALWMLAGLWSGTTEGKADHENELT